MRALVEGVGEGVDEVLAVLEEVGADGEANVAGCAGMEDV